MIAASSFWTAQGFIGSFLATSHLKRVDLDENWPASWKASYLYDLEEVYGQIKNRGYAYAYDRRRRATFSLVTEVLPPGARIVPRQSQAPSSARGPRPRVRPRSRRRRREVMRSDWPATCSTDSAQTSPQTASL